MSYYNIARSGFSLERRSGGYAPPPNHIRHLGLLFGSLTSLFQQPGRWLQAPFIRRSSCVPCLRLRGGFTGAWSAETRSCFALVCMQAASSGWKRGNWLLSPHPEAIALNIFGQNQKAEKLQTTRLLPHADFEQSDAWFQRVARDCFFFFFSMSKVETFHLQLNQ